MLGLRLATDPRWAELAENDLPAALSDHAYCEQKAASHAISLILQYPQHSDLVAEMARVAQEEMAHFAQVHHHLLKRGWALGPPQKDAYVNQLAGFIGKGTGPEALLLDRLLFSAMIEARSCERFRILSERVHDAELAAFYRELLASEAEHYTLFLGFARSLCGREVADRRWDAWLAFEATLLPQYNRSPAMHG